MRLVNFACRSPVVLLGVLAVAFIVWVWSVSRAPQPLAFVPDNDDGTGVVLDPNAPEAFKRAQPPGGYGRKPLPLNPMEKAKPAAQGTAQVLSKLKPGMTRAEVEELVGTPATNDIHPATVADGKVIYHTTYEADLEPPPTVRPIRISRPHPVGHDPQPKERTLITLEYDATKPGHPLLGVYYPDPLF